MAMMRHERINDCIFITNWAYLLSLTVTKNIENNILALNN